MIIFEWFSLIVSFPVMENCYLCICIYYKESYKTNKKWSFDNVWVSAQKTIIMDYYQPIYQIL